MYRRMHGGRHRGRKRDAFYCSARWLKLRKEVIAAQPICADPFGTHKEYGEVIPTKEVDHVLPRRDRPDLELVIDNLMGLCKSCHARKTRKEMQSRGLP